jgi:alkylation response protein AidB-like acyl-CoA dehydrogenase
MDFSLSDVQTMLADSVEKFVMKDYDFESRQKYAASETGYSAEVWQIFCELGWTAVPFADDDGGFDGGPIETMILMQQFGRGLVVEPYLANIVLAGGILRRVASLAQKKQWLLPLIAGELQAALAFVEPQSRYELSNIETSANPDNDGWIINGRKGVVLNGGNADLLIIPARTAGDTTATDGISLFAIDGDADGVSRRAYPTVDGHQAAEIELDNVRVDANALLGETDQGFTPLESTIDEATLAICAEAVGIMQVLTDKTVDYAKNRVQFGVPIGTFQALQHRMVDMLTASELCYSLLLWATMANADQTDDAKRAISAIKYQVGTAGTLVGQEAVQLHGGMGISWELDIGHYFKRLTTIGQMLGNADWHLDKLADNCLDH